MVTQKICLNTCELNHVIIYANEGEVQCRYVEVVFKDDETNDLSLSGYDVTFYAKKPDGTSIFNNCTVDTVNNTATVELTSQTLSVSGVLECEFQIFNSNGPLLKVGGLKIAVAPEKGFSEAIESTDEFNVLIAAINEARSFSSSVGDLDDLTTTEKSTITGAINELNAKVIPISQGGTGAQSATAARTNLEVMKAYSLYNNSSGTSGTVTLSDSSSNYEYIEIYFKDNDNCYASFKAYGPNGKTLLLTTNKTASAGSKGWIKNAKIEISGSSITFAADKGQITLVNNGNSSINTDSVIWICSVIGYKY